MPPKKANFTSSINPELYEKSHKPASTIAMGMKGTQASSQCWANQVQREEAIRAKWTAKYDPADQQEAEGLQALEKTLARDAARRAAYVSLANNPEIHAILYKKPSAMAVAADPTMSTLDVRENTNELKSISTPVLLPSASSVNASSDRLAEASVSPGIKGAAAEYLKARCNHHTLQQRFPEGPATAAQVVGWAAATSGTSFAATARTAPHRRPAGAYRKPEDEDHAALLGFDYTPK